MPKHTLPERVVNDFYAGRPNLNGLPLGSCWEWQGKRFPAGYGRIVHKQRTYYTHRVSWSISHDSDIPAGMQICHRCDNPACVRPSHLFLGTPKDNMQDRERKKRSGRYTHPEAYVDNGRKVSASLTGRKRRFDENARGEQHGAAKLITGQVIEIRQLYARGWSQGQLAARYGVAKGTISNVVRRQTWRHVA